MRTQLLVLAIAMPVYCVAQPYLPAMAQAGSTGGTLGNSDKSISGDREGPPNTHSRASKSTAIRANGSSRYIGCFRDQGEAFGTSGRDLNGSFTSRASMTSATCVALCRSQGFAFAGAQHSEQCFCGASYGRSGGADNCNMACGGNPAEMCGGLWANSVYATGVASRGGPTE